MLKDHRMRLLIMPLLAVVLLIAIMIANHHLLSRESGSVIYTYLDSLDSGMVASGTPASASSEQSIMPPLEPGDIILGGWSDCAYGKFSHVGMYAGNRVILEALVDTGVYAGSFYGFAAYPKLAVIRIKTSPENRKKAVDYVTARQGEMFYPLAFKTNPRYWNCSTILWRAYYEQGVDIDCINDIWIAPESLMYSPQAEVVYKKGLD